MRKPYSAVFIFLLILTPIYTSAQQVHYIIEGSIKNQGINKFAYLYVPSSNSILKKSIITNRRFSFSGYVTKDDLISELFLSSRNSLSKDWYYENINKIQKRPVVLENQTISVRIINNPKDAIIKGGELNDQYNQIYNIEQQYAINWRKINNKYNELSGIANNSKHIKEEIDAKRQNELLLLENSYFNQQVMFVEKNITSPFTLYILNGLSGIGSVTNGIDYNKINSIYEKLPEKEKTTELGKRIKNNLYRQATLINQSVNVNDKAPSFSIRTSKGKMFNLNNYKGKYILLDFWASWCGPCRGEFPYMKEVYKRFHDKGLNIFTISLDTSELKWEKASLEEQLPWIDALSPEGFKSKLAELYHITFIPQNFLIGPNGNVIAKNMRGESLMKGIQKILK